VKKTVRVRYFAILREQRGLDEERVATEASTRVSSTRSSGPPRVHASGRGLRVAINDEFAPWSAAVRDGDALAFLPPVAGG
jgi:molybdopterin converting factor small subunit